jgi:ABC-type polysaccharide/polyol phosphate transport system ATPase subunit
MTDTRPIIEVKHVTKYFSLEQKQVSLRHHLLDVLRRGLSPKTDRFLALDDVSFSVQSGEAVGIVGANGMGKTTLLRLIANIIQPTSGEVIVRGQYVPLLGIGAGFVDNLSGRKNIFLNAAIHGVNPPAVEPLVDDIIAFADIGLFIDEPIRHYSAGMRLRLGFSIAMHILPEIVLLDEVLSVGDHAFREKSYQRLTDLLAMNRTVLVVSHSEQNLRDLCTRAIWLHHGKIHADGAVDDVLRAYHNAT